VLGEFIAIHVDIVTDLRKLCRPRLVELQPVNGDCDIWVLEIPRGIRDNSDDAIAPRD
jgi:hypothetical protein